MNLLLIEDHDDGVNWGVSFKGPNPDISDYVGCKSKEDALRLISLVENIPSKI